MQSEIPVSLKSTLVDDRGVPYREFRRTLAPRYGRVWRDIALAYAVIVTIVVAVVLWAPGLPGGLLAAAVASVGLGYVLAYLNNFFHEAAHHNLLPDRKKNDIATNVAMGWLFGSSIATYRKIHFQHHRALGTTEDSENSYFDPLGLRYLVGGLFGLKVIRTLRRYRSVEAGRQKKTDAAAGRSRLVWMLVGAGAHCAIVVMLTVLGEPAAALTWAAGVLVAFPFFVSLRQVLEHRSEEAESHVDYRSVDHGAVNRLFGDGPLASTLGSAGFNRHAIHHWEPNVSYTRLKDIEQYLLRTQVAPVVRQQRTTYADTFLRLFEL